MKKFLFFIFTIITFNSWSHEIRPAFLQIIQNSDSSYDVFWKVPSLGDGVPKISPVFAPFFSVEVLEQPNQIPGSVIYSYRINSNKPLQGSIITIEGLNKTLIDALVSISYLNGEKVTLMLQPDKTSMIIPEKETLLNTIKTYLILGTEHILLGVDHLLFVLALLLITPGFRKLIKTITAFTIAHSITLSLSALGFVGLPGPPVEAVIALSIIFLAYEIIKYYRGEESIAINHPWIIAFAFGLLHGFGFAGALTSIGLPQTTIPAALLFFNIGVELGQILFIVSAIAIIWLIKKSKISIPDWVKLVPVYGIGSIASFWLIERIVSFWA
ncbi:HupE/UreJ family protein [Xanthomarina spongicola]|uniref:HupE/UreJ protein n=1 Tax=Xanthomarina spongicola TaxID=570520 RepID=A0A316DU59_9FLAO|nr:HupE/UreJ family protein [Xanthomarina spongicola]PWK21048.1 HupE/UreJ protein [Xanthomarina spongicola]